MITLSYFAGIVTGLIVAALVVILLKRNETLIVKKLLQANTKIFKQDEKAEILPINDTETDALEQISRENDEKNIDTKL